MSRYADRARHIRNKPVVNRDPVAAALAALRSQLAAQRAENVVLRRALAAEGRDAGSVLSSQGQGSSMSAADAATAAAASALVEQLSDERNTLERENVRMRIQLVRLCVRTYVVMYPSCVL